MTTTTIAWRFLRLAVACLLAFGPWVAPLARAMERASAGDTGGMACCRKQGSVCCCRKAGSGGKAWAARSACAACCASPGAALTAGSKGLTDAARVVGIAPAMEGLAERRAGERGPADYDPESLQRPPPTLPAA